MSIFRKSGMVNVKMVITEEKILSNIDKIQKLINPNSKKQIVQLEEDSYFKDLVESVKTYLLEYPKKKNFPKNVYKAAYELVEYATSEFEDNTRKIEKLIRKREKNIKLGSVLKDVTEAVKAHAKNWKEIVEKLSKKYPADISEALYIIGNTKDKNSEAYIDADKLIQAKIKNLEQNFHIEIDMERIDDRSKALSYIGIEIAEALKYIPAPAEDFISDNEVEKVVPIQDVKVPTQNATAESVAAKIETEVMVQPKPRVAVQIVEEEAEVHDEEQEVDNHASESAETAQEIVTETAHEESKNSNSVETEEASAETEVVKRNISKPVGRIDELSSIKTDKGETEATPVAETIEETVEDTVEETPVAVEKPVQQVETPAPKAEAVPEFVPVPVKAEQGQGTVGQANTQETVVKPVAQTAAQPQVQNVATQQPVNQVQPVRQVQQPQMNRPVQPVNQAQRMPNYNGRVQPQQVQNGYNGYQQRGIQQGAQQRMQYYGQYNPNYAQQFAYNQYQNGYNQQQNPNQFYGQPNAYQQAQGYGMNQGNSGYATMNSNNTNEFAQSGKGKRFNKKPSLWQRIKNSKIGKKIGYLFRIRLVVQYPELPEGQDKQW